jgi:hypothetical protein
VEILEQQRERAQLRDRLENVHELPQHALARGANRERAGIGAEALRESR